jgi:uncharacterized membrane protein
MERGNIKWFVLSGLFVGLSQTIRYTALTIAPVTVVTPIQRLSIVFRTLFSWVLNREHESFDFWVMLGIFISFLGAILLSISTEFVISSIPLPEAVVDAVRWEWP